MISQRPLVRSFADARAELNSGSLQRSFQNALSLDPFDDEALFNLAVLIRDENSPEAIALLDRAVAANPLLGEAHRERAFELLRAGRLQEAEHGLHTALSLNSNDAWAHVYLGHLYSRQHRPHDAEIAFTAASDVAPLWAVPAVMMGLLLQEKGDDKAAEEHFALAAQRDPLNVNAAFNLARFFAQAGRTEEARSWAEQALKLDPTDRRALQLHNKLKLA